MKKGWEKRFDKMWFAKPEDTTVMNWEGLFQERTWTEKILGIREWRNTIEQSLKEQLADMIKDFIKSEEAV